MEKVSKLESRDYSPLLKMRFDIESIFGDRQKGPSGLIPNHPKVWLSHRVPSINESVALPSP
jgi:hypothetical protein